MPNNIDLVIIKPGSPKKMYGDLSSTLSAIAPPFLGALTAGFIREQGYSVKMIDTEAEGLDAAQTAEKIIEYSPLLVDILVTGHTPSSSSTPLMVVTGEILKELRKKAPGIKSILTGIHPTALPEKTLKEEKTDFIGKGESFYTILELLKLLKSNQKIEGNKVDGLLYLENGKVVDNGWGRLIEDLDKLPLPAWDLLPMDRYRAHNWHCFGNLSQRKPYAVIYTSLGCPYNCSYCNVHALYSGKPGIRFWGPEKVVEQIDLLVKNYKVKNIQFLDELFTINEERLNQICDLIIQRGYNLNIWAYARINTVNEEMLRKMKRAGINWLCYGIESGSKVVRTGVNKLGFEQDTIRKVIKMTRDAGIYILGNFLFGLPDDNLQTMQETFDLAKEINCEYVNFYATMAYPGSQLYEEALKKGTKLPDTWLGFAQLNEESLPLPTKYLSGQEVLRFRDNAFQEYCSNPKYLETISDKFGSEALSHIKEMLKYEIKRKFV
ncbi:MAG: radical SAM protein [bacterium]